MAAPVGRRPLSSLPDMGGASARPEASPITRPGGLGVRRLFATTQRRHGHLSDSHSRRSERIVSENCQQSSAVPTAEGIRPRLIGRGKRVPTREREPAWASVEL